MKNKKTLWVLTSHINDYDQHGDYFEAAWIEKPTSDELLPFVGKDEVAHVLNGGGRKDGEDFWWFLVEIEAGKQYKEHGI